MTAPSDDENPTTSDLESIAAEVANKAAAVVRSALGTVDTARTKSSATDVVTHVDIEVEEFIRNELILACPGSGVVGEELDDEAGSMKITKRAG